MNEKCKNCKFWAAHQPADRVSEPLGGDCRRNSPIATWPKVNKNDWCGEFEANGVFVNQNWVLETIDATIEEIENKMQEKCKTVNFDPNRILEMIDAVMGGIKQENESKQSMLIKCLKLKLSILEKELEHQEMARHISSS